MQVIFKDQKLADLYETGQSKRFHPEVIKKYINKINFLRTVDNIGQVYTRASLHCEQLGADREGQLSIRLNRSRRLIFTLDQHEELHVI